MTISRPDPWKGRVKTRTRTGRYGNASDEST